MKPRNKKKRSTTAYLPLHHQLFGEQHGLVAEGLSHLHPSGRVSGTAWTFDTWAKDNTGASVRCWHRG